MPRRLRVSTWLTRRTGDSLALPFVYPGVGIPLVFGVSYIVSNKLDLPTFAGFGGGHQFGCFPVCEDFSFDRVDLEVAIDV